MRLVLYVDDHGWDFGLLGEEVRRRRIEMGMSQQDVAALGGPSVSVLSSLESGKAAKLSYTLAMRLEDALSWTRGSVRSVLQGGAPTGPEASSRVDPVVQAIAGDLSFNQGEKQALILFVRALRSARN